MTDDPVSGLLAGVPVLGPMEELEKYVSQVRPSQLIAVGMPASRAAFDRYDGICQKFGVRFLMASDFGGELGRKFTVVEDDGIHFFGCREEPLECPFNRFLKRTLDCMIAAPTCVFILPVASLIVWLIQRVQSPGPLFYRQSRTGMHNEEFTIYKFRTMHFTPNDDGFQARKNDDRVYPLGRWLRKLSIDEIPQFLNVLRGEMSVVGPRPHLKAHDEQFAQVAKSYHVRSLIKPGITGLAQVRDLRGEMRTDHDVIDRVDSDLAYLEHWSFLLDGMIVFRTLWKMIFPPKTSY